MSAGIDTNDNSDSSVDGTSNSRFFRSSDNGATWSMSDANLYVHTFFSIGNDVYSLAINNGFTGAVAVRKSTDDGVTFGTTVNLRSSGGGNNYYVCPPSPFLHDGRLYMPIINTPNPSLGYAHNAKLSVLHIAVSDDPMVVGNWSQTNEIQFSSTLTAGDTHVGFWEPSIVETPSGDIKITCRVKADFRVNIGAVVDMTPGVSASISYNTTTGLKTIPGGHVLFATRLDPQSNKVIAIANRNTIGGGTLELYRQRTCLHLLHTEDLDTWTSGPDLIRAFDWESEHKVRLEGYQYSDWIFDGNDIIGVVRHAEYGLANSYHNATAVSFYRIKNYYQNLLAPAPANSGTSPNSPYAQVTKNGAAV